MKVFTMNGTLLTQSARQGTDDGQLDCPFGISVDRQGRVFVTELGNRRVQAFTAEGTFLTKWRSAGGGQFILSYGITVDGAGRVLVTDNHGFRPMKVRFSVSGGTASMPRA